MSALTDFLLARIDEEQTAALAATPGPWGNPLRVLQECEAKRRIVTALHTWYGSEDAPNEIFFSDDDGWRGIGWCVQMLALPYADHPDYDPAWMSAGAR